MSCPICKKPTMRQYRPFCSSRCADLDLARWFNGAYAVPSQDPDDTEDDIAAAMDDALRATERNDKPH
ncbi:MAG: DNA gyrase inhibitor YacG [Rhodobacteraceae bacterium]|nr:DNA gyrase inhibitor YacG [Paracoccaceae bacterium]